MCLAKKAVRNGCVDRIRSKKEKDGFANITLERFGLEITPEFYSGNCGT